MDLGFFIHVSAAGILAAYVLIIFALWAPRYGLPQLDFSRGMTQLSFGDSFEGPAPYGLGIAQVLTNGILFALLYATVVGPLLPGEPLVIRGLIWGVILFFGAQLIFVPIFLQGGIFSLKHGPWAWVTALVVHVLYGVVVGWLSPIL